MTPGKAYKLAALASGHRAKAIYLLQLGDSEGAKREDIRYLDCLGLIPSVRHQQILSFFDECVKLKLEFLVQDGEVARQS